MPILAAMRMLLPAVLLALLCGCASDAHRKMYAGEVRPAEQRALLHVTGKRAGYDNVFIIGTVDGERTIALGERFFYPYAGANSVEVLPGRHVVVLSTRYDGKVSLAELWFVAEAGHSYAAKAEETGGAVRFRIEDEASGQAVGGVLREFSEPQSAAPDGFPRARARTAI